jgi:LemA protein
MKPIYVVLAAIGALLLFLFLGYYNMYNKAVGLQEGLDEKFANVQSAYQRRADLIPNLLNTVKAAAQNEKDILTQVTQARTGITQASEGIKNAKTPEDLELMGRKINTAINLAYEAYPQIRSTENFSQFQSQLEGTENRIKTERDRYNEAVKEYNTHIRGFFARFFLNSEEFPRKEGFAATAGAENAPKVKF